MMKNDLSHWRNIWFFPFYLLGRKSNSNICQLTQMKGKHKVKHMVYKSDFRGNLYQGLTGYYILFFFYRSSLALKFWATTLKKDSCLLYFLYPCLFRMSALCLSIWNITCLGIKMLLSHVLSLRTLEVFPQCLLALLWWSLKLG